MFRIYQSKRFVTYDCLWYDIATSEDTNKWNNLGVTATYSDNGTNIKPNTNYRYQIKYSIVDDLVIEFDVYIPSTVTNNPVLYVRGQSPTLNASDVSRDNWHTYRIECRNLNMKYYCDGEYLFEQNPPSVNSTFQFRVTNSELTFKNFRIYPI